MLWFIFDLLRQLSKNILYFFKYQKCEGSDHTKKLHFTGWLIADCPEIFYQKTRNFPLLKFPIVSEEPKSLGVG